MLQKLFEMTKSPLQEDPQTPSFKQALPTALLKGVQCERGLSLTFLNGFSQDQGIDLVDKARRFLAVKTNASKKVRISY